MTAARRFVYLGWHGFANFGDDLLFETWRDALDDALDVSAPLSRRDYANAAPRFLRDRLRLLGTERVVLLGGGTTVGFGNWAGHMQRALRYFGARGAIVPGAGAAESADSYALALQAHGWADWRALDRIALLGVRGPLTAAECERNWEPAPVIGDPALLWPVGRDMPTAATDGPLGVCVGSDPTSRFVIGDVAAAVSAFAEEQGKRSIRVFQLSDADVTASEDLVASLRERTDVPVEVVRYAGSVDETMRSIAECSGFVSERLHGAIAAVSVRVPTVMLAYASKCDDFWSSITGDRAPIGVGHSVADLLDELRRSVDPAVRRSVEASTEHLQRRLAEVAARMNTWSRGDLPTPELLSDATVGESAVPERA